MGMKFLNKKGWHTGSLRNIENVWKAEQKHDAEQKKLEELRKQLHEERQRSEFRLLQEQAGLIPKQERLDFLYESGLAVGKASASDGFKALEAGPKSGGGDAPPSSSASAPSKDSAAAVPGALFEEKPHSANDSWRKLHSDPLLMIRQREQEALARVKNNPVQMAMIRKSVEVKQKKHKRSRKDKEHGKKRDRSSSKHQIDSSSSSDKEERRKASHRKSSNHDHKYSDSEDESPRKGSHGERNDYKSSKYREQSPSGQSDRETARLERDGRNANDEKSDRENHRSSRHRDWSPGGRSDRATARDRRDASRSNDRLEKENYRTSRHKERSTSGPSDRETVRDRRDTRTNDKSEKESYRSANHGERSAGFQSDQATVRVRRDAHDSNRVEKENRRSLKRREHSPARQLNRETERDRRDARREDRDNDKSEKVNSSRGNHDELAKIDDRHESHNYKRRGAAPKLSEEERAAKLREMQMDAEVHEDQRWRRLKTADEEDAKEASRAATSSGKNFLDAAQKSIFGTDKGGSASIAESVRRRTHYSQGRSENGNAFRR